MKRESTGNSTNFIWKNDRILIIAPNWLGDAVMATPSFKLIRDQFPHRGVDLLCRSYVGEIFRRNPNLDRMIEFSGEKGYLSMFYRLRRAGPTGGWEACFVFPGSFSSGLTAWISGSRERIGYSGEMRKIFLTVSLPAEHYRSRHLSRSYLKLVESYTGARAAPPLDPLVVPPRGWRKTARNLVGEGDYFVLAAGASYGSAKIWPRQRYSDLAGRLWESTGMKAVTVGTEGDRETADMITGESGARGINLSGRCSLGELISVLNGASLMVGNDSGPVHIAAALGVKTVTIFGSTSPEWTAPLGRFTRTVINRPECSPCFKRECPDGSLRCLKGVEAGDVYEEAIDLLQGR